MQLGVISLMSAIDKTLRAFSGSNERKGCTLTSWGSKDNINSIKRGQARSEVFVNHFSEALDLCILPVVICLSQRLSHACLSINNYYTVKLRMAH